MSDFQRYMHLQAGRAYRIGAAFDSFIDTQIGIGAGTRERASASHSALRGYLRGLAQENEGFPRILRDTDRDFLGGSFARHTKIWPLNDIDVYLPIDGTGLVYSQGGFQAPYTVLTDEVLDTNPLAVDRDRWWDGGYLSSAKLINGFAEALRSNYPVTTRVRRVGEAVMVTLSNDLGFDVVPCFSLKPHAAYEDPFYLIPDGSNGWIKTNPRLDQQLSDELHRKNNRSLRRAVKLFKWWSNEFVGGRIESYYAELAIMRAFELQNRLGTTITSVSVGTCVAFQAVRDAVRAGDLPPILNGSPAVESGALTTTDLTRINQAVANGDRAIRHEQADQIEEAFEAWRAVFGHEFPTA
ncbi:hypothetical protein Pan44_10060 [Caulifigura coniformis]|uniref:Nucleotidyltransferase n=1 Tax=Caulifigura coniformis TaxID=2527983 RepID=A0A517SA39_9PLAN|nr:nucleotidyltransferase [Caulifigura coniformis]QDT52991.1 hypothetical protein Pan44_10060 [Caulifigura coniformis]